MLQIIDNLICNAKCLNSEKETYSRNKFHFVKTGVLICQKLCLVSCEIEYASMVSEIIKFDESQTEYAVFRLRS